MGPSGLLTDRVTGAPVASGEGSFFGNQNGVFQLRRVSVSGLLSYTRDSFSASISNERRTATISWGHQFSDRLNGNLTATYGVNDNGAAFGVAAGSQTSFTGTAGLAYIFTETLTGRVQYTHTESSGVGVNGLGPNGFNTLNSYSQSGSYVENALLAGLRKSF